MTDPRLPDRPDAIVVWSDLNCSFAHLAVHRLIASRHRMGLDGTVRIDHRAFPLELFNECVNERPGVDSEVAVIGALEPEAGWRLRRGPDWTHPVTMLPALEAVQAAKRQGPDAAERLDRALRVAFWADERCISLRSVLLEVAAEVARDAPLDVDALATALDTGIARADVIGQFRTARDHEVECSPHVFLHDGSNWANPGVRVDWVNGGFGTGFPVVRGDDAGVWTDILDRAAGLAAGPTAQAS